MDPNEQAVMEIPKKCVVEIHLTLLTDRYILGVIFNNRYSCSFYWKLKEDRVEIFDVEDSGAPIEDQLRAKYLYSNELITEIVRKVVPYLGSAWPPGTAKLNMCSKSVTIKRDRPDGKGKRTWITTAHLFNTTQEHEITGGTPGVLFS